jgi:hypothetical protein
MVNAKFPKAEPVWFRNGGCAGVDVQITLIASIENLRRIKSFGFFTNFPRFRFNADTYGLSAQFKKRVDCEINRNKIKNRGRDMFFLLRMAFWLGLVLVLLPREKTPESEKLPQVGASEAVSAATAAVSDMTQFCKRQPAACEVGGQAATVIGHRATEGARKLYQIITDKKAPDHTGSIGGADHADAFVNVLASRDTLSADDLAVEWRVPPSP